MAEAPNSTPKLFISYSWSSPEHENWVVSFAEELVSQGIHVILDKWDLKPGHDANAFMESMVNDPDVTKVALICDAKYAEKSNKRAGGAGTEAQIISPELYAKKAQDKFAAVVRERDNNGQACLPVYYKGRIYFDLSEPATYATEFERLVRWVWDKPLYARPEIGKRPAFLSDEVAQVKITTSVPFRRAFDAIRNGRDHAVPATVEYFDTLVSELEKFRISYDGEQFDDLVVKSITDFLPFRNELIEIFLAMSSYQCSNQMVEAIHRLFEKLIPYLHRPENLQSWHEGDFDNFSFIIHELFLYCMASFLKSERFDAASYFLDSEYYFEDSRLREVMHPYTVLREYLRTLEHRNSRLDLKRLSVRAEMLKFRNQGTGIDFKYLMAADFVLYLRSRNRDMGRMWWPETLIYAARFGFTFEMFARAKSQRYFERIKGLLCVNDKDALGRALDKIEAEPNRVPKWQYEQLNPRELVQFGSLATIPYSPY